MLSIDFFSLKFWMKVFLYLQDMYIDCQLILSSCGCIGNKCIMGVGLPLLRRTKKLCPCTLLCN